jgi:hypothetical protein
MSNNDNTGGFMASLEKAIDNFFEAPGRAWQRFAERFFEYTYRETEEGVFGLFNTPEQILDAAGKAKSRGYTNFDCLTPFPVHGLEHAMGLNRSRIPYITFFMGLTGTTLAFLMQLGVHEQVSSLPYFGSYPLNIAGKPTYSWPAMVPILFELTVLFGGVSTAIGFLLLAKLPKSSRKVLHPEITNDRFALWLPSDSANYTEESAKAFLTELRAEEITVVRKSS